MDRNGKFRVIHFGKKNGSAPLCSVEKNKQKTAVSFTSPLPSPSSLRKGDHSRVEEGKSRMRQLCREEKDKLCF